MKDETLDKILGMITTLILIILAIFLLVFIVFDYPWQCIKNRKLLSVDEFFEKFEESLGGRPYI